MNIGKHIGFEQITVKMCHKSPTLLATMPHRKYPEDDNISKSLPFIWCTIYSKLLSPLWNGFLCSGWLLHISVSNWKFLNDSDNSCIDIAVTNNSISIEACGHDCQVCIPKCYSADKVLDLTSNSCQYSLQHIWEPFSP